MRVSAAVITLLVAVTTSADTSMGAAPSPTAPDSILAYYPPAALAKRIRGLAVLDCVPTERGAPTDCRLVSERPAGHGFGAAALAIAAHSVGSPNVTVPPERRVRSKITYGFGPTPPMIGPDPPLPLTHWIQAKNSDPDPGFALDQRAVDMGAQATLLCAYGPTGSLSDCQVLREQPAGFGVSFAALRAIRQRRLAPTVEGGSALGSGTVVFDVNFSGSFRGGGPWEGPG